MGFLFVVNEMKKHSLHFSIIIPTYKRRDQLAACLESTARLDYLRDRFEVIVVDDGGQISPEETVARVRTPLNITLIKQVHGGPAKARNLGAAHAKGTFLAFTDDDCILSHDWLKALRGRFDRTPDSMIGGRTLNKVPHNIFSKTTHLLIEYLYSYYNANPGQARFFASNNLALPKESFLKIGGFNPVFSRAAAEDREFCERWLRRGYSMIYAPEALISHLHPLTPFTFFRQHFNYGRGAFHFRRMQTQAHSNIFRIEPLSFYSTVLTYPFSHGRKHLAPLFCALLMLTQMANANGFLWEWAKHRRNAVR